MGGEVGLQAGTVSLATSKLYTRAVLPPALPGSWSGAGLACSSSGTPAWIAARDLRLQRRANQTHLPAQIRVLGTETPSPADTGTRGRNASVEELKVANVARAPARFRAFPHDTRIALEGTSRSPVYVQS